MHATTLSSSHLAQRPKLVPRIRAAAWIQLLATSQYAANDFESIFDRFVHPKEMGDLQQGTVNSSGVAACYDTGDKRGVAVGASTMRANEAEAVNNMEHEVKGQRADQERIDPQNHNPATHPQAPHHSSNAAVYMVCSIDKSVTV
jgi:hypothetical protein